MYNLFVLYLRCFLVCLCKDQDTKYIATKGLVLRSTVERMASDKQIYLFEIKEYTKNSTKQFHFNAKTEVILLKGSSISIKQKNKCGFTAIEDVKVDATKFEISSEELAMATSEDIFKVKNNATLALVCYCSKKFNELEVLTLFDDISYENNSIVTKNYRKHGIYCTDIEFITNERTCISGETFKMDLKELVLIQTNKIQDLFNNKTIITEIPINGIVEISNIDTKKLLNVKEDANVVMNNIENEEVSKAWIFELVFGLSLGFLVLLGVVAVVIYYTKRRNTTIANI